jgi:quercetin dioxygenase-like cupin family protein
VNNLSQRPEGAGILGGAHLEAQARRVVTGVNSEGKSCIAADEATPTRLALPSNTKCDIWRVGRLPALLSAGDGLEAGVFTLPSGEGMVYRVVTFAPDEEWDQSQGFGDSQGQLAGSVPPGEDGGIAGLHVTESLDISTVLSGELYAILETEETLLRAGDTIVQRGTKHSWSNRSGNPVTLVSVMISARFDAPYRSPSAVV